MIRRNILSTPTIGTQYAAGVRALKDPVQFPWPGQAGLSIFDFFVFLHHQAMYTRTPPSQAARNAAHAGPVFLPWHRYMLLMFEFYMRSAVGDDDFRLPYWDWAGDAALANPTTSALWSQPILGQFTNTDFPVRVEEDPFSPAQMRLANDRALRRTLGAGGRLSNRDELRTTVRDEMLYDTPLYTRQSVGFRDAIEGWRSPGHHNSAHVWIGGDMQLAHSPNDPAFYLIHCNVDRVWSAWQDQHGQDNYRPLASESVDYFRHRIGDAMFTLFNHGFDITPEAMFNHDIYYTYDFKQDLVPAVI